MDKALRREAGHDQGLADDDSSSTPRGSNGPGSVA